MTSAPNNNDTQSVNDWYGDMLADAEEDEAKAAIIAERDAVLKALDEINDDQFITVVCGEIEVYEKHSTAYRHDVYGYAIGLCNPSEDDLIEQVRQERCAAVEIYEYTTARRVHTDYLRSLDLSIKDLKGRKGEIIVMDEEEYNNTILANSCEKANFEELYDDDLALVCVVIVEKENL